MKNKIFLDDKIFIAGASGMVGSAIHKALLRSNYGNVSNNGLIFTPKRSELDLLDIEKVKRWFELNQPSVVVIAAAKVGGILANSKYPTEFLLNNLKIQINLIETAWEFGVKRLLFLGSSCIYPKFAKQPIEEESLLTNQLEESNQWYAISKITGIKLCEALRIEHNFDAISLMPTNLYGPGDNYHPYDSHVMASFIRKFYQAALNSQPTVSCWGTGSVLREFLYVDDLAEAVIFCLEKWDPDDANAPRKNNGDPLHFLNVGSGSEISIKELAIKISKLVGFKGQILWDNSKPDGTPRKKLNSSKINNLGWYPKTNLDDGIKKVLKCLSKKQFEI